jgi:hypothetical protein
MATNTLSDNLRIFYHEMEERLAGLPPEQQQQYLEGLVHAFDAMTRYASPLGLTPFEREEFIGSAKSAAYSKAYHLNLDPETRMKGLVESDRKGVAESYLFAAQAHAALRIPLDQEQIMRLDMVITDYSLHRTDKK